MTDKTHKNVLFIGIGIFFFLAVSSIAYLFRESLRILLLSVSGIHPLAVKLMIETTYFFTFVAGVFGLLKVLKTYKFKSEKLFLWLIGLLIFAQLLQFAVPYFLSNFHTESYFKNTSAYYNFLRSDLLYETLDALFEYLVYIVLGIVIYKNRNLILLNDTYENDLNEIGNEN